MNKNKGFELNCDTTLHPPNKDGWFTMEIDSPPNPIIFEYVSLEVLKEWIASHEKPSNIVNEHECTTCGGKAEIQELCTDLYFCYNCIT